MVFKGLVATIGTRYGNARIASPAVFESEVEEDLADSLQSLFALETAVVDSSETVQPVSSVASQTEPEADDRIGGPMPTPLARINHLHMGLTSVSDILEHLAKEAADSTIHTMEQVVAAFAFFSNRECDILGLPRPSGTSNARDLLEQLTNQYKVRLGRTSLVAFLKLLEFKNDVVTIQAVAAACELSAKKHVAFANSEAGRKIDRALASCV